MQIRDAVQSDFDEITAIYNHVLTNSTAIYSDRPASVADRLNWWHALARRANRDAFRRMGMRLAGSRTST